MLQIIALAFVPIPNLDEVLDALAEHLPDTIIPLLDWFEDNYVGRPNRRRNGRRDPLFPPNIWNVYKRTLIAEDRTNNRAEAAHRRLQTKLGVDHPSIWKFIDGLRKVQKSRDVYMEQLMAGQLPPIKLKKFRDADENCKNRA
jgi:hypothetical protein